MKILEAINLLFSKRSEDKTEHGRSKDRYRRIALSATASAVAKTLQLLISIISVSLTANYLGVERYGLWVTITSLVGLISFADFGLGNGLLNYVARSFGKQDRESAVKAVSSAYFLLLVISFLLSVTLIITYQYIPWSAVFNVSSEQAIIEAGPSAAIFIICFAVNIPLGIVQKIQMAYQESYVFSNWSSVGHVVSFCGLLFVIHNKLGLPWLVLTISGIPIVFALFNWGHLFYLKRIWLRPKFKKFERIVAMELFRLGGLFFVLQFAGAMAYSSDNFVIAQILGAESVTQYALPMKLFMLAPMFLGFIFAPLWPAYGEAIARNDYIWVKKTLIRSVKLGLAVNMPAAIILVSFGSNILHAWIGNHINPSMSLLVGMGIWLVLNSLSGPFSALFNGAGVIRFQVYWALIMSAMNLTMSISLVLVIGIEGAIYGTIIAQILFGLIPALLYLPRLFNKIKTDATINEISL